jgi:hypothetical protein
VNEAIPSNNTPLGELAYNNETLAQLRVKAENSLPDLLWQLIDLAHDEDNYYFTSDGGAYRFRISNSMGVDIAESIASEFNDALATEITNLVVGPGLVTISNSTDNDGSYIITGASANEDKVTVTITTNLASLVADGILSFGQSFAYTVNKDDNKFIVGSDLTTVLFVGNTIEVSGSDSNDGLFTILSITLNGSDTEITVKEEIPSADNSGNLMYTKSFGIQSVTANTITFKGGYDNKAVADMVAFITDRFFSHEGLHVLEHVLLRPKVRGMHFVDADAETLTGGLTENGSFYFLKTLPLYAASNDPNSFQVEGDISSEIDHLTDSHKSSDILVTGNGANDAWYAVSNVQYDGVENLTTILTHEDVAVSISDSLGELSYYKGTPITSLSASAISIEINDSESLGIVKGEQVEIRGSTEGLNDGKYIVDELIDHTTHQQLILGKVESYVEDNSLEIVLEDDDCDACGITDPYTCVASVILPHWQGRFDNMDFRRFFEKQLRQEAPAHVFLNICWISCEQMTEFELKYKAWLVEHAKKEKDYGKLSATLNDLIDIHSRLRNVYPSGTLHDCEEDETLENAIILDNSVLGNA